MPPRAWSKTERGQKNDSFLIGYDVARSLDDPKADEGPDGIHVGGVGKADDHVLPGNIGRQRFELPAHQEVEHPPGKTQYVLHGCCLLWKIVGVKR